MTLPRSDGARGNASNQKRAPLGITDGEINFLWSFIQGSIINPETWTSLLNGYGFCQRHAWVHFSVETAFRERYLLGPTILYAALVERALSAVHARHAFAERRLLASESCLLCNLNIADQSRGACPEQRLLQGRDTGPLMQFALDLKEFWNDYVCDICKRHNGEMRCRKHFLADLRARRPIDHLRQQDVLRDLNRRLIRFQESFTVGKPKASDQDRASLIAAIGWCAGWRPLLALLNSCESGAC
jgi:hypothetical protein